MNPTAVLPARLESARIARKVLADLGGKPLLWHVWQQVSQAACFSSVLVATDSPEIAMLVESWGGTALLTQGEFRNGTERIASIAHLLDTDYIVNVQADMPQIDTQVFQQLLHEWEESAADVITPVYRLANSDDLWDPHLVKVAVATNRRAVYFSRQPVPYMRDAPMDQWVENATYWGHIGIYGFTRAALRKYAAHRPGPLELAENLEQLRFLEAGMPVMTCVAACSPIRVDSASDLARARICFAAKCP